MSFHSMCDQFSDRAGMWQLALQLSVHVTVMMSSMPPPKKPAPKKPPKKPATKIETPNASGLRKMRPCQVKMVKEMPSPMLLKHYKYLAKSEP